MKVFQNVLWGYEFTYPDNWGHATQGVTEVFSPAPGTLEAGGAGRESGQLMVQAEWNCSRRPIQPIWSQHIALTAGMIGAKKVGSAPWHMAGATGLEAEIVLPKQENKRLWTGVLISGFIVMKLVVVHTRAEYNWYQPHFTQIISSLRFHERLSGISLTGEGIPLPPNYLPVHPASVLSDISNPEVWRAYHGTSGVDALQAFYIREAPANGWEIDEYVPFPSPATLGFARLRLRSRERAVTLGLLPYGSEVITASSPAQVVYKLDRPI